MELSQGRMLVSSFIVMIKRTWGAHTQCSDVENLFDRGKVENKGSLPHRRLHVDPYVEIGNALHSCHGRFTPG